MQRAIVIPDSFDAVPTLSSTVTVAASDTVADDAATVGVAVGADGEVPAALQLDRATLDAAGFAGKAGQLLAVPTGSGIRVAVGVGPLASIDSGKIRDAAARFANAVSHASAVTFVLPSGANASDVSGAAVEGIVLARYRWDALKSSVSTVRVDSITIVAPDAAAAQASADRGALYAHTTAVARDLCNAPPAHMSATRIADLAVAVGPDAGLGVEVYDRDQLIEMQCGGIIAVNGGSEEPPRLVKLTYVPDGVESPAHLAIVGKGVMYDSGGISLKPGDAVHATMKNDMSGAGALLATMLSLSKAKCPTAVTAYLVCTDNMPSGTAVKLGDVMTVRGGTTVEIINTDAEGRLVMADALVLAAELEPDAILDIATLTGACMRALGEQVAGVMGNNAALIHQIREAGEATDEPLWELPLEHRYRSQLDSDVADLKNLGGANAGAITAALFLETFVDGRPWAHIDIAGTAQSDSSAPWRPVGCTGFGARLLLQIALDFEAKLS
jgi:leucyl aminopeptidase